MKLNKKKEETKQKSLNVADWFKPVIDVQTSIGRLYLFPLRSSDCVKYNQIIANDIPNKIKSFLPCFASLSPDCSFDKERDPLTKEKTEELSSADVGEIVNRYIGALKEKGEISINLPESTTDAMELFDRHVCKQYEIHEKTGRQIIEQYRGMFSQVRKYSSELEAMTNKYEHLSDKERFIPTEMNPQAQDAIKNIYDQQNKLTRERNEDREMVRLTGQMTAQSSKTLASLADSATNLLEKMDKRDEENKKSTNKQIGIAVKSIKIAVLSIIVSVCISIYSCSQDRKSTTISAQWQDNILNEVKSRSGLENEVKTIKDEIMKWQNDLLNEIKLSNQYRSELEQETKSLKETVFKLQNQVLDLQGQISTLKKITPADSH